jgi:hypothetical protein
MGTAGAAGLGTIGVSTGCTPKESTASKASDTAEKPRKTSSVPLRIWVVGAIRQPDKIVRQWAANSEQSIQLRSLTADELLSQEKCAADVLLYPSRLLGDLEKRQWITKLPKELSRLAIPDQAQNNSDEQTVPAPPGLMATCNYQGTPYALPMGYSMINLVSSQAIDGASFVWPQLREKLVPVPSKPLEFEDTQVEQTALVDRFLAIAIGNSKGNARYGLLFDIHTLKAKLTGDEFQFAGDLLQRLASQTDAVLSVVGSHSASWQWVNKTDQPGFALLSPSHLSDEDNQLDSANPVQLTQTKTSHDGSGIIASITSQCQQSFQSIQFMQWLYQPKTLESLHGQVAGMISTSARGRTLPERIVAANGPMLQSDNVVTEPRMPGFGQFRTVLANQLIAFLRGQLSCTEALAAANETWTSLAREKLSKGDYEKSLQG